MLHYLLELLALAMLAVLVLGLSSFFIFLCENSEEWQRMQDHQRQHDEVLHAGT